MGVTMWDFEGKYCTKQKSPTFTIEQIAGQIFKFALKTKVLDSGTRLANVNDMRSSINHKALTMILGVLVAFILILTLWMRTPQNNYGSVEPAEVFPISTPDFKMSTVPNVLNLITEALR